VALAIAHGAQLATFDRRVIPDAVRGGASGIHLIQSQSNVSGASGVCGRYGIFEITVYRSHAQKWLFS
jgi:hypothetical protein